MPICSPRELLKKYEEDRRNIQLNISKLESQIFEFEGSYLKETGAYGNAVKVNQMLNLWARENMFRDGLPKDLRNLKLI